MSIDEFWARIERIHRESEGVMDTKCERLERELTRLEPAEVVSFEEHFRRCDARAYSWDLWAAAYVMNGGCGDSGFSDFRATLISMGRDVFERALADPDTLADTELGGDDAFFEGFQYVANGVYMARTGDSIPVAAEVPSTPSGIAWNEDEVANVCPRLARKFEYPM